MRAPPAREHLEQALKESGSRLDLDTAMRYPAFALALTNHAEALERARSTPIGTRLARFAGRKDWRALAANDQ